SHQRKSRMVEISLSGSGEGLGRATSQPTLQATFHARPPARISHLATVPPLEVPLSGSSPPAAGELGRRPGPAARRATRSARRTAGADLLHWGCKRLGRLSWDGCNPLAPAEALQC